jgi:hypothetical protein
MKPARALALAVGASAALFAQQFKFDLDRLAAKASNTVDVSLSGPLLQLGARFLDSSDPDEAKVKKMIAGIEGIYVRHFEFKQDGAWTKSDLDGVRSQLKAPEWQRIVGWNSAEEGETAEVFLRLEGSKMTGLAILATEPKAFTVVNIAGPVDLDALSQLGGHFGVPKVQPDKPSGKKK